MNTYNFEIIENFIDEIKKRRLETKNNMQKLLDEQQQNNLTRTTTTNQDKIYEHAVNNLKEYHEAIKTTIKEKLQAFQQQQGQQQQEAQEYFSAYAQSKKINTSTGDLYDHITDYIIHKIFLNPRKSTNSNNRNFLFAKGNRTRKDGRKRRRATHFENMTRKLRKLIINSKSHSLKTKNTSKNLPTHQTNSIQRI